MIHSLRGQSELIPFRALYSLFALHFKMRFAPIILLIFATALAAANPAADISDALSPEYCPGGDGATCCPKGYFSVRSSTRGTMFKP